MFVTIADIEKIHNSFANQHIENFNYQELAKRFKEQNIPLDIQDLKLVKQTSGVYFHYQVGHIVVSGTAHQKGHSIHHFELRFTDFDIDNVFDTLLS